MGNHSLTCAGDGVGVHDDHEGEEMIEFMRLHVNMLTHPKFMVALKRGGADTLWMWLGLLSWMHRHEGEGCPVECIGWVDGPTEESARARACATLLEVGLFDRVGDQIRVHDYDHWSAESGSFDRRLAARERKRRQRAREADSSDGVTHVTRDTSRSVTSELHSESHTSACAREDQDQDQDQDQPTSTSEAEPPQELDLGPTGQDVYSAGSKEPGRAGDIKRVFDCWRRETKHPNAKLDTKRKARIKSRLTEGFTVEQLELALRNWRNDGFLAGNNDRGRVYDGLETLLRDAAKVEQLMALTKPDWRARGRGQREPPQESGPAPSLMTAERSKELREKEERGRAAREAAIRRGKAAS